MRFLIAAFLLVLLGCQDPSRGRAASGPDEMEERIKREITERMNAYGDLLKSKDAEWYSSYWAPDARYLATGADITGRDVIASTTGRWASGEEFPAFEWEAYDIFVHGDVAYLIGRYDETSQRPGMDPEVGREYAFIRWERNLEGQWWVTRFLTTPRGATPDR